MNYGTLQMAGDNGQAVIAADFNATAQYIGAVAPLDAGGDPFAQDYHSWDSDFGHLSYNGM